MRIPTPDCSGILFPAVFVPENFRGQAAEKDTAESGKWAPNQKIDASFYTFPSISTNFALLMEKMTQKIVVYHNARCSKSRCALEFLQERQVEFTVVEYLKDAPTKAELTTIIDQLGIAPEALIRKGEDEYKLHFKGKSLSNEEWIDAMLQFPKLIERPIVVVGDRAVVARPTERILELL
jgi:arsenate reductase